MSPQGRSLNSVHNWHYLGTLIWWPYMSKFSDAYVHITGQLIGFLFTATHKRDFICFIASHEANPCEGMPRWCVLFNQPVTVMVSVLLPVCCTLCGLSLWFILPVFSSQCLICFPDQCHPFLSVFVLFPSAVIACCPALIRFPFVYLP